MRGTGALREILPYYRWGMLAGVVGAFVVAVFFPIIDLAAGRPFATPTALGATVFLGELLGEPFDLARAPSLILVAGYSAVHGGLFVGLALLVSSIVLGSRRPPPPPASLTLILIGFFFAGLTLLFLGFLMFSSATFASAPSVPLVLSANLLSATSMAWC